MFTNTMIPNWTRKMKATTMTTKKMTSLITIPKVKNPIPKVKNLKIDQKLKIIFIIRC